MFLSLLTFACISSVLSQGFFSDSSYQIRDDSPADMDFGQRVDQPLPANQASGFRYDTPADYMAKNMFGADPEAFREYYNMPYDTQSRSFQFPNMLDQGFDMSGRGLQGMDNFQIPAQQMAQRAFGYDGFQGRGFDTNVNQRDDFSNYIAQRDEGDNALRNDVVEQQAMRSPISDQSMNGFDQFASRSMPYYYDMLGRSNSFLGYPESYQQFARQDPAVNPVEVRQNDFPYLSSVQQAKSDFSGTEGDGQTGFGYRSDDDDDDQKARFDDEESGFESRDIEDEDPSFGNRDDDDDDDDDRKARFDDEDSSFGNRDDDDDDDDRKARFDDNESGFDSFNTREDISDQIRNAFALAFPKGISKRDVSNFMNMFNSLSSQQRSDGSPTYPSETMQRDSSDFNGMKNQRAFYNYRSNPE